MTAPILMVEVVVDVPNKGVGEIWPNSLVLSILEPVGRLGSFSVMDHVNPIGFSISHHV